MKKSIILLIFIIANSSLIYVGCKSTDQKEEDANTAISDAKATLQEVTNDRDAVAKKAQEDSEWAKMKAEATAAIEANEEKITALKEKSEKKGRTLDALYVIRVDSLKQRNKDLRNKINDYEITKSEWSKFKSDFNKELNDLNKSISDFTENNTKQANL